MSAELKTALDDLQSNLIRLKWITLPKTDSAKARFKTQTEVLKALEKSLPSNLTSKPTPEKIGLAQDHILAEDFQAELKQKFRSLIPKGKQCLEPFGYDEDRFVNLLVTNFNHAVHIIGSFLQQALIHDPNSSPEAFRDSILIIAGLLASYHRTTSSLALGVLKAPGSKMKEGFKLNPEVINVAAGKVKIKPQALKLIRCAHPLHISKDSSPNAPSKCPATALNLNQHVFNLLVGQAQQL